MPRFVALQFRKRSRRTPVLKEYFAGMHGSIG
jgi:hypothetical protein